MSDRRASGSGTRARGLMPGLQDLADGMVTLFQQHLRLFKVELKYDAMIAAKYAIAITCFASIALVGFSLLNVSVVLFAALAWGTAGAAVSCLGLAALNSWIGLSAIREILSRMRHDNLGPIVTGDEVERSKAWAKNVQSTQLKS